MFPSHSSSLTIHTRTFRIWFDDKLREVYATNDFSIVRMRH